MHYPRVVTLRNAVRRAYRARRVGAVSAACAVMRKRSADLRQSLTILAALCAVAVLGCESMFLGPPQYASVSVVATDSAGMGVPDVWLQLYTGVRIIAYGTTDPSGRYLFTDVPPGGYGVLLVTPPGYKDTNDSTYMVVDKLTVAAGTIEPVRFTLNECRGVIDATVTELVGASAQGVNLLFYTAAGPLQLLQTDAGGARSLGVICGQYGVRFDSTLGYASPTGRNSSYVDGLVVHRNTHVSAALRVQSCFGALRVTVLDAANAPVSAAGLVVYTSTSNLATGLTGADGRYTFARVPCPTGVGVAVSAPAGYRVVQGRGSSFIDGLLMANNVTMDVTFHLAAP